jgi:hypothetical protein
MFGLTILEIIYIATAIMAGVMMIVYVEEAFNQIDNAFIKFKEERKTLVSQVQTLEKQVDELKCCDEEIETSFHSDGRPTSGEINKTLVTENRKLLVRCDMLEEELSKLRQQNEEKNEIENKYSFRLLSDKKTI